MSHIGRLSHQLRGRVFHSPHREKLAIVEKRAAVSDRRGPPRRLETPAVKSSDSDAFLIKKSNSLEGVRRAEFFDSD